MCLHSPSKKSLLHVLNWFVRSNLVRHRFKFGLGFFRLLLLFSFFHLAFDWNNQHINVCIIKHIVRSQFPLQPQFSCAQKKRRRICDISIVLISIVRERKKKWVGIVWVFDDISTSNSRDCSTSIWHSCMRCQCNLFTSIKYWTVSRLLFFSSFEHCSRFYLTGNHLLAPNIDLIQ